MTIWSFKTIFKVMSICQKGSPRFSEAGFSPILIIITVVLFVILLEGGYVIFTGIFANKETSVVTSDSKKAEILSGWQTFNYKYGQMKIGYPKGWLVKYDKNKISSYMPVDFIPPAKDSVITTDYMITLNVYAPAKPYYSEASPSAEYYTPPAPKNNFNLPGLGEGMNAYFSQSSYSTTVYLTRNSIDYVLTADISKALNQKMDPAEITTILTQMAKSIEFTDEIGSCDDPVLAPLKNFPDNFILSNYHDSDKSDIPTGYWPNVSLIGNYNDSEGLQLKSKGYIKRYFLVSYKKEGQPFNSDDNFTKTVVPITGGDYYSVMQNHTVIFYINCMDSVKTGSPIQFFYIGNDGLSKFEIDVYGAADNPQKLWSVDKWNTDLLKKTRSEVYIKMGDQWQKYSAKDFYTAL